MELKMKKISVLRLLLSLGLFGLFADEGDGAGSGEGDGAGEGNPEPKFGEEGYKYASKYVSVEDLEKGYVEQQSHFNAKLTEANEKFGAFKGAPEGDYEPIKDADGNEVEGFSPDVMSELQAWGKENGLSQDKYEDVITRLKTKLDQSNQAFIQEELKKLGKDADIRIKNINDAWVAQFGEESKDMMNGKIVTAADAEFYESIIEKLGGQQVNPDGTKSTLGTERITHDALNAAMFAKTDSGQRKTLVDPEYAAKVEDMIKQYNKQKR